MADISAASRKHEYDQENLMELTSYIIVWLHATALGKNRED
jgi:hypothetical protein